MMKSMKSMKALALTAILTLGFSAKAATFTNSLALFAAKGVLANVEAMGLNLKEGDNCMYALDMGGFLKGTMDMGVDKIVPEGVWLHQNLDMMIQKSKVQILLDPNTGEIKKMIVDGKEQTPPKSDIELVETKEETITVPAGTYTCVYFKAKDKTQNQEVQQWINMKEVPVMGMVKSIMQSQFGPVTIELQSFKKM